MIEKIIKTEEEWKKILSPQQYNVLRKAGTEAPFSCLWGKQGTGAYDCAACGLALFSSDTKYESGMGWPSYFGPIDKERIEERLDTSFNMVRTEVLCARCGSHLGHIFEDPRTPTKKDYCINSLALNFKPTDERT